MDNNIIEQLINIEDKAQKISKEAHDEEVNLQMRINAAIKTMASEIEAETAKTVDELKKTETSATNIRLNEINALNQQQYEKMENEYLNCREKWENDLFNSIVGR